MKLAPSVYRWQQAGNTFVFQEQQLFYRRHRKKSDLNSIPVILIHGYPTSSYDFCKIWPLLTQHYDVVTMDMLGMCFSDKPWERKRGQYYAIDQHTESWLALLRKQGIQQFHVIAHDLGVRVAQEMLARELPGVQSVTFLNGGLFAEVYKPRITQKLLSTPIGNILGPLIPKLLFVRAMREMFAEHSQPTQAEMEAFWQIVNANRGRMVTHQVGGFAQECRRKRDRWVAPLMNPTVPLRFINGSLDLNSGQHMAKRYRELVPNPGVVELANVGHWPQFEAPKAVFDACHEFIQNL